MSSSSKAPQQPQNSQQPRAQAQSQPESQRRQRGPRAMTTRGGVASKVMTTTSTRPVVTVDLDTAKESLARRGARVTVELPSAGTVRGRVASVGKVAHGALSGRRRARRRRCHRRGHHRGDDPARPNDGGARSGAGHGQLRAARAGRDVLAVPVTALLARSGGDVRRRGPRGWRAAHRPRDRPASTPSGWVEIEWRRACATACGSPMRASSAALRLDRRRPSSYGRAARAAAVSTSTVRRG